MLTHSVAVDVWDVCPKAWMWFCQWRLSALQISHGGPMAVNERREKEGRKQRWLGGEKEEKKEKLCEKQGFAKHYITFISPPCLPSLLLSNISD